MVHYGERSDNGDYCDGLDKTDLASDHTHEEEHAQTDAVDEDFEAELADENHPDDLLDPDGYCEVDHGHVEEPDDMPGEEFTHAAEAYDADPTHAPDSQEAYEPQDYDGQDAYEPQDSYHQDYDYDGHDNQEPPDENQD